MPHQPRDKNDMNLMTFQLKYFTFFHYFNLFEVSATELSRSSSTSPNFFNLNIEKGFLYPFFVSHAILYQFQFSSHSIHSVLLKKWPYLHRSEHALSFTIFSSNKTKDIKCERNEE